MSNRHIVTYAVSYLFWR